MESNLALISVASGLERLMVGNRNNSMIKDSNVAQISAFLYYNAHVIAGLEKNKTFHNKFKSIVYGQINKDFGEYIDANARTKPKSLHHVYEWNKTGQKAARLFRLNFINSDGLSFKVDYELMPSKTFVPNSQSRKKYKFENKAYVMESDMPVIISPSSSKRLVFESHGVTVFMPKGASVTVKRPGGSGVKNQFGLAYSIFFSGQLVNSSIKKSGFQKIFNSGVTKALKLPPNIKTVQYKFSANSIKLQADASLVAAFGGAL